MRYTGTCASALLIATILTGCYPDGPETIDEYDLVYTNYSPTYDFKAQGTYALPDSVVKVTGNLAEGEAPEMVNPTYGNQILGKIRDNMNSYGWTEVQEGENPDVLVLPSVVSSTTIVVSNPGYWGWYYPWYGGWYYPGYYPPTYVSGYTTGTLVIQMVDPNDPSAADNLPIVWLALFNGLLEGSSADLVTRLNRSIDQAYDQSNYLKQ